MIASSDLPKIKCDFCSFESSNHAWRADSSKFVCEFCKRMFDPNLLDTTYSQMTGISANRLQLQVLHDGIKHVRWGDRIYIQASQILPFNEKHLVR